MVLIQQLTTEEITMNENSLDFYYEANRLLTDLVEKRQKLLTTEVNSEWDFNNLFYEVSESRGALDSLLDDKFMCE